MATNPKQKKQAQASTMATQVHLLVLLILAVSPICHCQSWGWSSSSSPTAGRTFPDDDELVNDLKGSLEHTAAQLETINETTESVRESYADLGKQVDKLKIEALEIKKQIAVGEVMASKVVKLQTSINEIKDKYVKSLQSQHELSSQITALKGLLLLTKFRFEALQASRKFQSLAEHSQLEEILQRKERILQILDHLIKSFKMLLAAQEDYESKQAAMLLALDELFALHKALMLESGIIKTFFICSITIVMLTVPQNKRIENFR